jgi:AmmeMemoRadiSam system protein A
MPENPLGLALLATARNAINARFELEIRPIATNPELQNPGASFVTLTQDGHLRGCIGSLEASRALADDVAANAVAAAFRDTRFAPLSRHDWTSTRIEVSLLEPSVTMACADEDEAIAQLRPGVDGVILTLGKRRATFLPQVWESLPDPRQFMARLKLKAGLPVDFWDDEITLSRYGARRWKER